MSGSLLSALSALDREMQRISCANAQSESPEIQARISAATNRLKARFSTVVRITTDADVRGLTVFANGQVKKPGEWAQPIDSVYQAIEDTVDAVIAAYPKANTLLVRSPLEVSSVSHAEDSPARTVVRIRCVGVTVTGDE